MENFFFLSMCGPFTLNQQRQPTLPAAIQQPAPAQGAGLRLEAQMTHVSQPGAGDQAQFKPHPAQCRVLLLVFIGELLPHITALEFK